MGVEPQQRRRIHRYSNPIRMASGPEGEVPLPPFALTIGQFVEGMYPKGYNFLSPTLLSLSSLS